jgi:hypothetical protein
VGTGCSDRGTIVLQLTSNQGAAAGGRKSAAIRRKSAREEIR